MQQIWTKLNEGRATVDAHPFFAWLQADGVPLGSRFIFSPVMIDFIMSFADLNKWFLRYENPEGALQLSINAHTEEDATHSRLFVQNWENLKLGDTLDWPASKGLWWLFHAPQGQAVRDFGMSVLKLAVEFPDPRVRFCMMEAIEICGDVFFEYTAPIAAQLEEQGQGQHIYYGQYHRDRENGHLQSDEGCFADYELSPEQRARAEGAIASVYRAFLRVLDQLLSFSQRAVAGYRGLQGEIDEDFREELMPRSDTADAQPHFPQSVETDRAHADQRALVRQLDLRVQRLRGHSFIGWLKGGEGRPVERLRAFAPIWGIDVVGYKDFNDLVLSYTTPTSPSEQAINGVSSELAAHGALYLQDWQSLRLDELLGWRMIDVICYYFLSEDTEVHRRNMAKVKKYAMRHENPLVRWWLMFALERANEVFFGATRDVALAAESDLGVTLNFWAYRHGLSESTGRGAQEFNFLQQAASDDELSVIEQIINTVFDNFEEQFELSEAVSRSGAFSARRQSLAPPRVSELVLRTPPELLPKWASGAACG
jgi:hypothetical protein